MNENLIHWSDEAQLLGYGESDSTGAWLKFRITPEDLDKFRGHKGTVFYLTTVEIAANGQPVAKIKFIDDPYVETGEASQEARNRMAEAALGKVASAETKPFGKQASELYRTGFFYAPAVLEAIGTDAEFLLWLRSQPCAAKHLGDCDGDIVAAHVRRIANGAGTGIKPDNYSAIPLCHKHHALQHQNGESALAPAEDNKK